MCQEGFRNAVDAQDSVSSKYGPSMLTLFKLFKLSSQADLDGCGRSVQHREPRRELRGRKVSCNSFLFITHVMHCTNASYRSPEQASVPEPSQDLSSSKARTAKASQAIVRG